MKKKHFSLLTTVFFLGLLSVQAYSHQELSCAGDKTPSSPQIPDGNIAGFTQMAKARLQVMDYIEQTKKHLPCVQSNYRHDVLVARLHRVAREFNKELKTYKNKFENS